MASPLPLLGARVLDLTRNIAGPYCSLILAGFGADVVKVESPGAGDDTRQWGPPFWQGESAIFGAFNRDKRSLTLDLKHPEARPILERAVMASDVLVESFRPGALEALGFGYAWAQRLNPRLVYCSITSYGEAGPQRHEPGYDPIMQAGAGLMSVTGEADGPPVRAGVALVDMGTGLWAATATLAALLAREQTGLGQRVVASLYETALSYMAYHLPGYWGTGQSPGRYGSHAPMLAPYGAFATQDGYLMLTCGNDRLFAQLAGALGHPEWASDPRFASNPERVRNRAVLQDTLEQETRKRPAAELLEQLRAVGVPCSPIRDTAQAAADPQAQALGIFQALEHPRIPDFRSVGLPVLLEGQRPPARHAPPRPGEHTREVLADWGFRQPEVERLLRSPAITGQIPARA